jgi:hypothetical protein
MFSKLMLMGVMAFTAIAVFSQPGKPSIVSFFHLENFDPANRVFRIEGYVLDIYKCPPCPPGAMCKPCIPDNITLVDSPDRSELSKLKRLPIYTDKTDKFRFTGRYRLTVKVKGDLAAGKPVASVDLVSIDRSYP